MDFLRVTTPRKSILFLTLHCSLAKDGIEAIPDSKLKESIMSKGDNK